MDRMRARNAIIAALAALCAALTTAVVLLAAGHTSPGQPASVEPSNRTNEDAQWIDIESVTPSHRPQKDAVTAESGDQLLSEARAAFAGEAGHLDEERAIGLILELRRTRSPEAGRLLAEVASGDSSKRIREQAIIGLADIPTDDTAQHLHSIADSASDVDLRYAAKNALRLVCEQLPSTTTATISVQASGEPGLGKTLHVVAAATVSGKLTKARLGIAIAQGLAFAGEKPRWRGDLAPGEQARLAFDVKQESVGEHYIIATLMGTDPQGTRTRKREVIYVTVREGGGVVGRRPPSHRERPTVDLQKAPVAED